MPSATTTTVVPKFQRAGRAWAIGLIVFVGMGGCGRRERRGGEAEEARGGAAPAARAATAGPPAPRIYEQCREWAPDVAAPPGAPEGTLAAIPERFRGSFPYFSFVNRFHMADVDHHGVFVDFGTAHRFKHTLGNWALGWSGDERDGRDTYTWAIDDPRDGSPNVNQRLYFFLDRAAPVTMRLRYRTANRRTLTGNLNGTHGFRLVLETGGWNVVDQAFPAEELRDGENYLQLYHDRGPTEERAGGKAYFRVDWIWFLTDAAPERAVLPTDAEVVREIAMREENGAEAARPALAVPLPATVSFYLEVPPGSPAAPTDPFVGFAYGVKRLAGEQAAAVTFEVGVTGDDRERRVVWSRDVGPDREGRWMVASSGSLGAYGGRVVRIDFTARGRAIDGFRAVWGAPTLFVSPAPGAARLASTPRNVIVLLIDTQRADHADPWEVPELRPRVSYRRGDVRTPALRALGDEGVVFDDAVAPENWTLPSAASLLTGLFPLTHRAQREKDALAPEVLLLPQFLQKQGFRTGAFVGNGHVSAGTGFERGWDTFKNYVKEGQSNRAEAVLQDALGWIRANKGSPFFLYVHTVDPHVTYDPPDRYLAMYDPGPYAGPVQARDTAALLERIKAGQFVPDERDRKRLHALYCGEVTYHDDALRTFWEALAAEGVAADTLLIVTADHGEEFFEHGKVGHGHSLFQELLHVPLLVRFPGIPAPRRVPAYVGLTDIAPTVIDLLNLGPSADAQGVVFEGNSLLPHLLGQRVSGPVAAFSTHQGERMAVLAGGWKLLMYGPTQTALLAVDGERLEEVPLLPDGKFDWDAMRPVVRAHPITVRALRILLGQFLGAADRRRWRAGQTAGTAAREYAPAAAQYDAATAERLRRMGYVIP